MHVVPFDARRVRRPALFCALLLLLCLARTGQATPATPTPAGPVVSLHDFAVPPDGMAPQSPVTLGVDGSLYGTTRNGGVNFGGTIYRIAPDNSFTLLYTFSVTDINGINVDGRSPSGPLIRARDGSFYGTTSGGGVSGHGTVFRMTTDGIAAHTVVTTLHSFTGGADGQYPNSSVIQAADGNFYGVTQSGTVFKLVTDGTAAGTTLTTLYTLTVGMGIPASGLLQATDGSFYGTTSATYTTSGSAYTSGGTVFRLTTDGTAAGTKESVLYSFAVPDAKTGVNSDGSYPVGLLQVSANTFYGVTQSGGPSDRGTIFALVTNGTAAGTTLTSLHLFTGGTDGGNPLAALIRGTDGSFYGTTQSGGISTAYGFGLVFKMTTDGTATGTMLSAVRDFTGDPDAVSPAAPLVQAPNGELLGTSLSGGAFKDGTVFGLQTDGSGYTLLHQFGASPDGYYPYPAVVRAADGSLYGTTDSGGARNRGTIFRIAPNGTLTSLYSFHGPDGAGPDTALIQVRDGIFYGTTSSGGTSGHGTVFRLTTDGTAAGTALTTLYALTGADGSNPDTTLVPAPDGSFYGTTSSGGGGVNGYGTVFRLTTDGTAAGTALTTLHAFKSGADGAFPYGILLLAKDGSFYGTTSSGGGGVNGHGTVFRLTTDGTAAGTKESVLYSFTGNTDGGYPDAGLLQALDGSFYGTTNGGGANGNGTVFRLTTDGTAAGTKESVLYSFSDTPKSASYDNAEGAYPETTLVQAPDGTFYGATFGGGAFGNGTLFHLTTDGTAAGTQVTGLFSFPERNSDFEEGAYGDLFQDNQGNIYTTAFGGGPLEGGAIYQLDLNPTTTATLTGTLGYRGSYTSPVRVALSALDPDIPADIASITYTLDGGTAQNYTAPLTVGSAGAHTITYFSTTGDGAVETPKTTTFTLTPLTVTRGPITQDHSAGHQGQLFQLLTVHNLSTQTVAGRVLVTLTGLTPGVTVTSSTTTLAGSPAVTVTSGALAPGVAATVRVTFGPTTAAISYGTAVYAGQ